MDTYLVYSYRDNKSEETLQRITSIVEQAGSTDINKTYSNSNTLLHYVAIIDHPFLIKILLRKGANIESRNGNKQTPLQLACACGNDKSAMHLINNYADIISFDQFDFTCLSKDKLDAKHIVMCHSEKKCNSCEDTGDPLISIDTERSSSSFAIYCRQLPSCFEKREVTKEMLPTCLDWCSLAKKCVGEEKYKEYLRSKKRNKGK